MALSVDTSGTAPRPDPRSLAAWAGDQRIFISSVMAGDMVPLRARVVGVVESLGAEPVWFEAFGGRDDDAEVAYLSEVDSSSIYLGILGRTYGRLDKATRMSATHAEYRRAEEHGLAVSVWVRGDEDVLADQKTFIDEVRTFHTTGSFSDVDDLAEGVRRRLTQMAASALSPWVKFGETVFRAREIRDDGATVTIQATVHSPQVLADVEAMRPGKSYSREPRLTHSGRSWPVRVRRVTTRTTAARSTEVDIELERRKDAGSSWMGMTLSVGGTTYTSDQLAERDLRQMLFGEDDQSNVLSLGGRIRDFTADLPTGGVSTDVYQAVFALLLTEALVESGRAIRATRVLVSPLGPRGRGVSLEWVGHTNRGDRPTTCSLSGVIPAR
jgi:hypothetical protein